ncbi:acylphosphatase [Rhizobium paknamense]|uniref:Acylphosphatase n=1 Tax=Rhizobium paknamense TaxID=1206817 RepID=A0ABU0IGW0_9HYPH|nr:acylphosphatase [Rhizobium paknamense]MDQ0456863.1 hypothetical protein [Rhizobium paknamense]
MAGALSPASFIPWIDGHAARLGLSHSVARASQERIEIDLSGPEELLDMMEVGCSLGPADVWVESIERHPLP